MKVLFSKLVDVAAHVEFNGLSIDADRFEVFGSPHNMVCVNVGGRVTKFKDEEIDISNQDASGFVDAQLVDGTSIKVAFIGQFAIDPAIFRMLEGIPETKPVVLIDISGGCITDITSDHDLEIIKLDSDTEGGGEVVEIDGEEVLVSSHSVEKCQDIASFSNTVAQVAAWEKSLAENQS